MYHKKNLLRKTKPLEKKSPHLKKAQETLKLVVEANPKRSNSRPEKNKSPTPKLKPKNVVEQEILIFMIIYLLRVI